MPTVRNEPPAGAANLESVQTSVRPEAFEGRRPILSRREAIEAALAAWRDAERRLANAADGDRAAIEQEVGRHRSDFQQLSADHMVERIGSLREAEHRRANATPSTLPFHEAARDTQEIASDIWEAARSSDEDTPETETNRRTTPRPTRPGEAGDPSPPDVATMSRSPIAP
jgi:hypothetical protein